MKVIFAGTPDFAASALRAIVQAGHEVTLVLTQPDRPKGRGLKLCSSAVKILAEELALPVWQPESLSGEAVRKKLADLQPDVIVVAAYGLLLPDTVLAVPKYGCLNIHASILPRWRGAAPIQRAIEAGDEYTGVNIMQMDAGLDTGDVLYSLETPIAPDDTASTLESRLTAMGAQAIVHTLQSLPELSRQKQSVSGVTYASKLSSGAAQIDWQVSADVIERKIRAFNPVPGAWTTLGPLRIKVWAAKVADITDLPDCCQTQSAGTIVLASADKGLLVVCGQGAIWLEILQPAGSKKMNSAQFLQGHASVVGMAFGV